MSGLTAMNAGLSNWGQEAVVARIPMILVVLLSLAGCVVNPPVAGQPPVPAQTTTTASAVGNKTVVAGIRYPMGFYTELHPDCTSAGYPIVRMAVRPSHGSMTTEESTDYPSYAKDNQRYDCNLRKVPGTHVFYQSEPNFVGADAAVIEVIFPSATSRTVTYSLTVK
jgi:hypothetical protein